MNRREIIAGLGAIALCTPDMGRAQDSQIPVVGLLSSSPPESFAPFLAAIREGLDAMGYVEGRNVSIEYQWADGKFERMPEMATALLARKVNLVITSGATPESLAVLNSIPVVTIFSSDPVKAGRVISLNRPGGNLTGAQMFTLTLASKRFELLCEVVPNAEVVALLFNPAMTLPDFLAAAKDVEVAARAVGRRLIVVNASKESDFEPAFEAMVQRGARALLWSDPFLHSRREKLVGLAARHAIPTIYESRECARAGGLMSYGSSYTDAYRKAGVYAGRILRGAIAADLPIDQGIKVELVLNLKTAKTLGITFPLTLLGRADEVIE